MIIEPDQLLAWFYSGAEGDLGAHAMSLEPTSHGEGQAHPGPSTRQIDAATRYRQIDEALHVLTEVQRRTLSRYYTVVPPTLRRTYGGLDDLIGVVLGLVPDHAELASLLARSDPASRARIASLRAEATKRVTEAHRAYRDASERLQRVRAAKLADRREARLDALLRGVAQ